MKLIKKILRRIRPRKKIISYNLNFNYNDNSIIECHPLELVPNRFDIKIKYLYANALDRNLNIEIYKEIYYEHLLAWNGFKEYDKYGNCVKNKFEDFDSEFKEILFDIKSNGFDSERSLIPIFNYYPLNGAHRIASALLYNKTVTCKNFRPHYFEYWNEEFFTINKPIKKVSIKIVNEEFIKTIKNRLD